MRCVAAGLVLVVTAGGCARPIEVEPDWSKRRAKMNEITTLWAQIRGWRGELHMDLEPTPGDMFQSRGRSPKEVESVCPESHQVPKVCGDVCSLADDICDNAEAICAIASQLGKNDHDAQDKCTSATASCSEAKQRCCNCSETSAPGGQR